VDAIRNIRGEMNVPPKVVLADVEIGSLSGDAEATVREELGRIHRLAKVKDVTVRAGGAPIEKKQASAVAVGDGFEVRVGLAGAVDVAGESARIDKELAKLEGDLAGITRKLENPSFVAKAPPEVVEKDRARAEELREKRGKLLAHRAMLSATADSPPAKTDRREAMENQNENPGQPTTPASQTGSGAMEAAEKMAATAMEVGKAAATAVVSGVESIVEKVMPSRKSKPAARKPAKKAAAKRKPAAKAKAKGKAAARGAAPRRAAAKTKAKARKPAARKGARKGKKR